jgi:hypothetical protein
MSTIHWYKNTRATFNTPATLLDEAPIREAMANLKQVIQASNA